MYFILSDILVFFLSPFTWALCLLLAGVFVKKPKWKKIGFISSAVILLIFSNPYLLFQFAKMWDLPPGNLEKGKVYSAAIILGGFTSEDKNGNGFFNEHADRLIAGMQLKETGRVSHIFMSGGNADLKPDQFTEAAWVKKVLKQFNLPDSSILIETKSRNTTENAAYTKQSLSQSHLAPPYLLVTSAFHMRRAMYIFKKAGVDVIPYPCNYLSGNTGSLDFSDRITPNAYALWTWNFYVKEMVGIVVAHIQK